MRVLMLGLLLLVALAIILAARYHNYFCATEGELLMERIFHPGSGLCNHHHH